jgi:hypothetical protein
MVEVNILKFPFFVRRGEGEVGSGWRGGGCKPSMYFEISRTLPPPTRPLQRGGTKSEFSKAETQWNNVFPERPA